MTPNPDKRISANDLVNYKLNLEPDTPGRIKKTETKPVT